MTDANDSGRVLGTCTAVYPHEPVSFADVAYKAFIYFKREADTIYTCFCVSVLTAFVCVSHFRVIYSVVFVK